MTKAETTPANTFPAAKDDWPTGPVWDAAKQERNWLVCELSPRAGNPCKLDKAPLDGRSLRKANKDAAAKLTFNEALQAVREANRPAHENDKQARRHCVGYLPRAGSAMVGIDMDDAIIGGGIKSEVAQLIEDNETYVEKSPSGTGLRGLISRTAGDEANDVSEYGGVGIFANDKKFFTVTGQRFGETCEITRADEFRARVLAHKEEHKPKHRQQTPALGRFTAPQVGNSNRWMGVPMKRRATALSDALASIPAPPDDNAWVKITAAIHSAGPEIGEGVAREIFDEWGNQIGGDQSQNDKRWNSFKSGQAGGATVATVFAEAEKAGWRAARHIFDPLGPKELAVMGVATSAAKAHFAPASNFHGKPVPARVWLVDCLVPMGSVTLFSGDGGTGKSLLSLQLAVAVALGSDWIGLPVHTGTAMFLTAEDDEGEIHRRLEKICQSQNVKLNALKKLHVASLAGKDALLATTGDKSGRLTPTNLYKQISQNVHAEKPRLLVLDTLADLFPGNENDRAQARQFVGLLNRIAIENGCAVVLLAHPSQHGLTTRAGTSGSTAWNGSVRSRLYLERNKQDNYEPDPDARTLSTKKSNYGPSGTEMTLRWKDGVFVEANAGQAGTAEQPNAKAQRVFIKLLKEAEANGCKLNSSSGGNYAPTVFSHDPNSEGVQKVAFARAMRRLLGEGSISIAEEGPPSKPKRYLSMAPRAVRGVSPPGGVQQTAIRLATKYPPRAKLEIAASHKRHDR